MKTDELRIGNNVYFDNKIVEISGVFNMIDGEIKTKPYCDNTKIVWKFKHSDSGGVFDISELKPIPLTEELLLRFGFKHVGDTSHFKYYEYKNNKCSFGINCGFNGFSFSYHKHEILTLLRIEFAHQLQNLYFVLTNEELTLK